MKAGLATYLFFFLNIHHGIALFEKRISRFLKRNPDQLQYY